MARVPAITLPPKTMFTPWALSSEAKRRLSSRLVLASVMGRSIGFWAPVTTTGLGLFCTR